MKGNQGGDERDEKQAKEEMDDVVKGRQGRDDDAGNRKAGSDKSLVSGTVTKKEERGGRQDP